MTDHPDVNPLTGDEAETGSHASVGRHVVASLVVPDPDPTRAPLQLGAGVPFAGRRTVVYIVGWSTSPIDTVGEAARLVHERRPDITRARAAQMLGDLAGVARSAGRYVVGSRP